MATYIHVNEGAESRLLRASREATEQNRARQLQESLIQATQEEEEAAQEPAPDLNYNPSRRRQRPEEEIAAVRNTDTAKIVHDAFTQSSQQILIPLTGGNQITSNRFALNTFYELSVLKRLSWTVYCGNRSSSLSDELLPAVPVFGNQPSTYTREVTEEVMSQVTYTWQFVETTWQWYRAGTLITGTGNEVPTFRTDITTTTEIEYIGPVGSPSSDSPGEDVYEEAGVTPSHEAQIESWIAANGEPPLPPYHLFSNIYFEEVGNSRTFTVSKTYTDYQYRIVDRISLYTNIVNKTFAFSKLVLPVGGSAAIVIIAAKYAQTAIVANQEIQNTSFMYYDPPPPFTPPAEVLASIGLGWSFATTTDKDRKYQAYLVTNRTIKRIPLPLSLRDKLDGLSAYGVGSFYSAQFPVAGQFNFPSGEKGLKTVITSECTPEIFELLNDLIQFTSPTAIKTFPSGKKPIVADTRKGFYADSTTDKSFYYGRWKGDSDGIDLDDHALVKPLPSATLLISSTTPNLPSGGTIDAVWDWNDPVYCRQMCLALGFSPANLTP